MIGGWIAYDKGLYNKREIKALMALMAERGKKMSRGDVVLACLMIWSWADGESVDGSVIGFGLEDLDYECHIEGFGEAMRTVGWVEVTDAGLLFPNWDRFNKETAKARELRNQRQARWRAGKGKRVDAPVDGAVDAPVDSDVDGGGRR